jgi:hypothetical protein
MANIEGAKNDKKVIQNSSKSWQIKKKLDDGKK